MNLLSSAKENYVCAKSRLGSVFAATATGGLGLTVSTLYNTVMAYCATPTPTPTSSGSSSGGSSVTDIISDLNTGSADDGGLGTLTKTVKNTGGSLINLLLVFGIACFIVAVMVFGIQMAIGNGQERNQSKSNVVWIIIGALCFFGAASIVTWLYNMASTFSSN